MLNFTFSSSANEERAEYKGLRVRAVQDESPCNPFTDHDGHWPMIVRYDGSFTEYDKLPGPCVDDPFARFTDGQLIHDQLAIAGVFATTVGDALSIQDLDDRDVKYCRDADKLRDAFVDLLSEERDSDKLELYAALYRLAGIEAVCGSSTGHSQGAYAEVLVVGTPEAVAMFGTDGDQIVRSLSSQINLYSAWAWGDVYGYVVEEVEYDEDGDETDARELSSCYGYFGTDHAESGLEESARYAVDAIIHHARTTKQAKLKELIRNHVPLDMRAGILAEAAQLQAEWA